MQERKKQNIINSFVIIVDNLLYLCCLKICASNQGGIVYGVYTNETHRNV